VGDRKFLGFAAAACVACCIGPILGLLGGLAGLTLLSTAFIGIGGIVLAAVAITAIVVVLRHMRRTPAVAGVEPGFVSSTWARSEDETNGHSLVLFENGRRRRRPWAQAKQGPPPGAPEKILYAEVYEVLAQA
jgi:hypothetical protein